MRFGSCIAAALVMSRVKASKQHRMVVVRHRPWLTGFIRAACVVSIAVAGFGGYTHGYNKGAAQQALLSQSLDKQQAITQALTLERDNLAQKLVNSTMGTQVDRKATEAIRQELLTLKNTLQKAQEQNTFYRNIMNPPKGQKGPAIGSWEVAPGALAGHYDFKLVIKQLGKHTNWVKGQASIVVSGLNAQGNNEEHTYEKLATPTEDSTALNVRFRYFQTLTGSFKLPANFTPQRSVITLVIAGKKTQTITKSYDW